MAKTKTFTPITRSDLKDVVNTGILTLVRKEKKDKAGNPTGKILRRYVVCEGKSVLDVVSAIGEVNSQRLLMDGLNREVYFNSGQGAVARLQKQLAKAEAAFNLRKELVAKVAQDTE